MNIYIVPSLFRFGIPQLYRSQTYYLVAEDGTVFREHFCSCAGFVACDLMQGYAKVEQHFNTIYGAGNWQVGYFWHQTAMTIKDLRRLVRRKYNTCLSKTQPEIDSCEYENVFLKDNEMPNWWMGSTDPYYNKG